MINHSHRHTSRYAGTAALVSLFALTACGGSSDAGDGDDGEIGGTLTISGPSSYDHAVSAVAEEFMKEYPEVTVTTTGASTDQYQQNTRTQLASGTASDLVYVWPGGANSMSVWNIASEGALEDLSEEPWVDMIDEDNAYLTQYEDATYMLPMVYGAIGSMYNTDVFDEVGLETPETWEDVIQACHTLNDAGVVPIAVGLQTPAHTQFITYSLVASTVYREHPDFNAQMADGEATFSASGWREAFEMYMELEEEGCFQDSPTGTPDEEAIRMVGTGEAAMMVGTNPTLAQIQDSAGETEIGFFGLPNAEDPEDVYLPVALGGAYGVSAGSENKATAKAFLEFMSENQTLFSEVALGVPIDTSQLPEDNEPLAAIAEFVDDARTAPYPDQTWPNAEVQQTHFQVIQDLFVGNASVDEALERMQQAHDR